jgi:hypothetical protein
MCGQKKLSKLVEGTILCSMKRFSTFRMAGMALLFLAATLFAGEAFAQQPAKTLKEQFVGTWRLMELYYKAQDGTRTDSLGPKPRGILRLDADGDFTLQIMATSLPKFASNSRTDGTAEENKAVVHGTTSYYGTYSVDEKDNIFAVHIEACTYPNFDGADQKRPFTLKGNELTFTNKNSSIAGSSVWQTWKRIK